MNQGVNYNERSWAIDLIGHLKQLASAVNRPIRDAGGEQTVKAEGGSLFPDVLLFGDRSTARILQGWELKFPDTKIDDLDFRKNAQIKAETLGLDSFLLWNVSIARLYVRNPKTGEFSIEFEWDELADIKDRNSVSANRQRLEALAEKVFEYLNDLFEGGQLEGRQFVEAYRSGGVTQLIMENASSVEEELQNAANQNSILKAQVTLWWHRYKSEYGSTSTYQALAQAVIANWIGKILFAQILRAQDSRAKKIASIDVDTTPLRALSLFEDISRECNFWTIFSNSLGLVHLPRNAWRQLKEFNALLGDLRIGAIDQAQLSSILETTVSVAVRKVRGQYPTPLPLARLLVRLCVSDTANARVLDPCCGSGTIPRAVLEQKLAAGVPADQASNSIFAGDQDPQALQIASFALARPDLMHHPLRLFRRDAFTLSPETNLEFRNPTDGTVFEEPLGKFDAIVSNLPFVAQSGRAQFSEALALVTRQLATTGGQGLSGRADVAAYLPFALHPLLAESGRLGIIITNAWLGTDWGDDFFENLNRHYHVRTIVTSGAGRWFRNSEVVTNLLILEKRAPNCKERGKTRFVVLKRQLSDLSELEAGEYAAAQIELGQAHEDTMTIRDVSAEQLTQFRQLGLGGNAQFVDCYWINKLPLAPLNSYFRIQRGERRGMNEFFYPSFGHGIEAEYLRPLLKGPRELIRPVGSAQRVAFTCRRTEEELEHLGHSGALAWIRHHKTPKTIKKLESKNLRWYELDADNVTELVMLINYGDRLFAGKVEPPAFVDQRFVRLGPKHEIDIDLVHALLNSTIGMFMIEGLGFGRGQGALDLHKDRIESYLHILDPDKLNEQSGARIKSAFEPLRNREILIVADELEQNDRRAFDLQILNEFEIDVPLDDIYDSLRNLVSIRNAATDGSVT